MEIKTRSKKSIETKLQNVHTSALSTSATYTYSSVRSQRGHEEQEGLTPQDVVTIRVGNRKSIPVLKLELKG